MALVICPDCGHEISENADICPNCGFPLQKFLEENRITNIHGVLICPKCADLYNGRYTTWGLPQRIKCEYCNSTLIQTKEDRDYLFTTYGSKAKEQEYNDKCIELAKQYGNNQFDEQMYEYRINKLHEEVQESIKNMNKQNKPQNTNTPHCPTCNSTNIHKISVTSKALNAGLFGLLSNKRKKQFHCNNCGYEW